MKVKIGDVFWHEWRKDPTTGRPIPCLCLVMSKRMRSNNNFLCLESDDKHEFIRDFDTPWVKESHRRIETLGELVEFVMTHEVKKYFLMMLEEYSPLWQDKSR